MLRLRQIAERVQRVRNRSKQANELGFRFTRAAKFVLPAKIMIGHSLLELSLPNDNGTRTAFIDIMLDDCYHLGELPEDLRTVLDIGGHVGLFSIAARMRWPTALIHTYEPNEALKPNWQMHAKQANFYVFEESVGQVSGLVSLVQNEDSVQIRVIERTNGSIKQTAFCKAIARMGDQVDLVKLDCEGAEWAIFKDEEAWRKVRFLTMEFHLWAGYTLRELKSRITDLGFQIRRIQMTGADFGILLACR